MALRKKKVVEHKGRVATIYWNPDVREYVVKLKGHPKEDYFTDDRQDAEGSARQMVLAVRRGHSRDGLGGISKRGSVEERTAQRRIGWDREEKTWRTREAMARAIRRQETKSGSSHDWIPLVSLKPGDGFAGLGGIGGEGSLVLLFAAVVGLAYFFRPDTSGAPVVP